MSQNHQGHINKEEAENPNRIRTLYMWNIIFLSCLTIVSLLFAMIVFFRLRTRGTDGIRKLYTEDQIQRIRVEESSRQKELLRARIQTSMEAGLSTTLVMREVFDDQIVVEDKGRYAFYPIDEAVDKNPLPSEMLVCRDGETAEYLGTWPALKLVKGTLLSDDNGRIDWDRLEESGIEETAVRAGTIRTGGFEPDGEARRNCLEAAARGISVLLCLDMEEPAGDKVLEEAAEAVRSLAEECGLREDAGAGNGGGGDVENSGADQGEPDGVLAGLVRIRDVGHLSDQDQNPARAEWTGKVGSLCQLLEKERFHPMIGGSVATFAARIDLSRLQQYERWLADHEKTVIFPYSFSCWEYSREGHLEGVPGESFLYARIVPEEELSIEEK